MPVVQSQGPKTAEWDRFKAALERALSTLPERSWLILSVQAAPGEHNPNYFVQFFNGGEGGFRAEAVSNYFLSPEQDHRAVDHRRLLDLGWLAPDPDASRPTDDVNYYREWPGQTPPTEATILGVTTLQQIFNVASPSELEYTAREETGEKILFPDLGLNRTLEA